MGEITRGSRVKVREMTAGEEIPWPRGCLHPRFLYGGAAIMCRGTVIALADFDGVTVALVVFDGLADDVEDADRDGAPSVYAWRLPVAALSVASDPVDDAIAAERARIGAWLRAQEEANVADRLCLSRGVEHGDHIDDDAPPLPSLRAVMHVRDMLLGQLREREAEANDLRAEVARLMCIIVDSENALSAAGVPEAEAIRHGMRVDSECTVTRFALPERVKMAVARRIDPITHAKEVLNGWLWWHSWWAQRDDRAASMSAWATSEERADLLALVGANVLAEVER